ncbi:MAG: SAF domain-containing protein [Nocardioides sp.]
MLSRYIDHRRPGRLQAELRALSRLRQGVRAAFRRVRRAVLLRRRFLAALLVGAAVAAGVRSVSPPPPETVPMLVAATDLAGGTTLGTGSVRSVQVPPDVRPAAAEVVATGAGGVIGRVLAAPVRRGEPITDVRLISPALTDGSPHQAAVPVRIPDPEVVGLLRVGDRVDILATDPEGSGTRVVASSATVLAIPQPSSQGDGTAPPGALVVLGATAGEARQLANTAVASFLSVQFSG